MTNYSSENLFAKILRGELPSHKVYEDETTLAFMDVMPRADGHTLVIPKAPARNILDIEALSLANLIIKTQRIAIATKTAMKADGITIQQNSESAGGQVVFHFHIHILPRYEGIELHPPLAAMADPSVLAAQASLIRTAMR